MELSNIDKESIIYLSGPITATPVKKQKENKLVFHCVEELLKLQGFETIVNPARFNDTNKTWDDMMGQCILAIRCCQVMVMLPGWQMSRGAKIEKAYAIKYNLKVIYINLNKLKGELTANNYQPTTIN